MYSDFQSTLPGSTGLHGRMFLMFLDSSKVRRSLMPQICPSVEDPSRSGIYCRLDFITQALKSDIYIYTYIMYM